MLVGPSIHLFTVPLYWGRGQANVYLIEGDRLILVDAGTSDLGCLQTLERELSRLNHRIEDLELIVNTHWHPDHTGGDAEIQRRSGAEIGIHPLDSGVLQDPANFWTEEAARLEELLTVSGAPEPIRDEILHRGHPGARTSDRVKVSMLLDESSTIELGSRSLRVVHIPGHTPGHIALHDPGSGTLFSGDHILQETTPNVQDLTSFVASLNKLLQLDPKMVLPGHEALIREPERRILELLWHHREREKAFLELLRGSHGKTLFQLSTEYWGTLSPRDIILALREAKAHMEKIVREGRALEQLRGMVYYYLPS